MGSLFYGDVSVMLKRANSEGSVIKAQSNNVAPLLNGFR